LSTVAPDKGQIARLALGLLERRITDGDSAQPQEGYADFRLVVRESTTVA
jgi:DNA-binding LacI/PurR family transcriptional regulator